MTTPTDETPVHTTSGQQNALCQKNYCEGGIEVLQELLRATLGEREANERSAVTAQEILEDVYGDSKSMSVGEVKLGEAVSMYKAKAQAHLEVSDMIETLLGKLTAFSAAPLAPPAG